MPIFPLATQDDLLEELADIDRQLGYFPSPVSPEAAGRAALTRANRVWWRSRILEQLATSATGADAPPKKETP